MDFWNSLMTYGTEGTFGARLLERGRGRCDILEGAVAYFR
jgi:hypothetical protein